MGLPEKLLGRDESVVRHMHEHIKALVLNFFALIVIVVALVCSLIFIPEAARPWGIWTAIAIALLLGVIIVGLPWLGWATSTYTVTTRRIITRKGIFTKTGHDIPLSRISNVAYERSLLDRILGCGTLILETSAENPLSLKDVPQVEAVHVELTELLFGSEA